MTTGSPAEHVAEAQKLTADALVDLYELTLNDGLTFLRFKDGPSVTWQTKTYESVACRITGLGQNADGSKTRPLLTVMNPEGVWNSFIHAGLCEGALVTRRQVLRQYLEGNIGISDPSFWYIGRVKEMVKNAGVTFELRSLSDGPDVKIPARVYLPPDFPFVTI